MSEDSPNCQRQTNNVFRENDLKVNRFVYYRCFLPFPPSLPPPPPRIGVFGVTVRHVSLNLNPFQTKSCHFDIRILSNLTLKISIRFKTGFR